MVYPKDICAEILYDAKTISKRAHELGRTINNDYKDKNLVLVCTLRGAVPFFVELLKFIEIECQTEYIKASSYIGNTTESSGNVKVNTLTDFNVENKDVLIIEDIVDTGNTYASLINYFKEKKCASVEMCTMLNKPSRREVDVEPKYSGFTIPNKFVIGFGLDYNEKYRNLPYIGVINPKYI